MKEIEYNLKLIEYYKGIIEDMDKLKPEEMVYE